ncbi:MAG: Fatty acid hydroxylase superfamily protein [Segetibacter sp.]|nr:Fatty acid hydroxylase superfamily protein [Segetibacter sp.]
MEKLLVLLVHLLIIFSCLMIYYFVPITIAYYFLYIRNKEKFRQYKIQQKYPTNIQIKREIKYSLIALVIFSIAGLFIYEYSIRGLTGMYFKISDYGMLYFFISLFITIFVNDTLFYWSHRFMHMKRVFRYVHLVHHKSTCPTPFAVFSFSPAEGLIHTTVYSALIFFIPIHPVMFVVFHLYNMFTNLAGHGGYEFMPEKLNKHWLFNWQNTVTNHDVHHKNFNCNYGSYFIFWDKVMNTLSVKK